jgi:hypothetical protein
MSNIGATMELKKMCHLLELFVYVTPPRFHYVPPPLLLDDESLKDCDLNLWCLLSPLTTPQITLIKFSMLKVTLLFEFTNIFPKPIDMVPEAWWLTMWLSYWLVDPSMVSNTKSHHWCIEALFTKLIPNLALWFEIVLILNITHLIQLCPIPR